MMNNSRPHVITTATDLDLLVDRLSPEKEIGVDVEADSMHHYREKVCLIQVSGPSSDSIIDPLAFGDISSLGRLLGDSRVKKILHGGDYDVRSLHRDFTIEIHNLFDTMIACQFLGEKEFGLA